MATPTDQAWAAALHVLNYLKHHAAEGVRFTEGADHMIAFCDASNKDDPVDGKTQYGFLAPRYSIFATLRTRLVRTYASR